MAPTTDAQAASPQKKSPSRLSMMYGVDEYRQELGINEEETPPETPTKKDQKVAVEMPPETPRTLAEIAKLEAVVHQLQAGKVDSKECAREAEAAMRQLTKAKEMRRLSKASFIEDFGIREQDEEEEEDFFAEALEESAAQVTGAGSNCMMFALGDDSSDDSDEDESIDDEYDFDHDKIAELVKSHDWSEQKTLQEAFAAAMADSFAKKMELKVKAKKEKKAEEKTDATTEAQSEEVRDVEGIMTPPEGEEAKVVSPRELAERMNTETRRSSMAKRRRSSMAKHAVDPLSQAMVAASQRHRKSLTARLSIGGVDEDDEKKKEALDNATRRHRQSISKVADVLEDADIVDDKEGDLDKKMALVQKALEDARREHNKNVAAAAKELEEGPKKPAFNVAASEFTPQAASSPAKSKQFNADAADFTPQAKKLNTEAAAFTPATPQAQTNTSWTGESPYAGAAWQPQNTAAYSKISQAMSSAFDQHCEGYGNEWDQGYGNGSEWQQSSSYAVGDTVYYSNPNQSTPCKPDTPKFQVGGTTYYSSPAPAKTPKTAAYDVGGTTYFEEPSRATNQASMSSWNGQGGMDCSYGGGGQDSYGNYQQQSQQAYGASQQGYDAGDGAVYYDQSGYQNQAGYGQGANCWDGQGTSCWAGDQYGASPQRHQPWRLAA